MRVNLILIFFLLLIAFSCEKEEEPNKTPTCFLTSIDNTGNVAIGDTIDIEIEANDRDGSIIKVELVINSDTITITREPHQYNWMTTGFNQGTYVIEAIATDNDYATASDEKEIKLIQQESPTANFTYDVDKIMEGEEVQFTNTSTGNPMAFTWDFGDGNQSTQKNPKHVYETYGIYSVSLTVSNYAGFNNITKEDIITVSKAVAWNIPCPGTPTVTDVEGNVYNTVQIGEQCWMKENLKSTKYASGRTIQDGTTLGEIPESRSEKYYFLYDNNENLLNTYGYLYNWYAIMNTEDPAFNAENDSIVQGICPDGWHVPSSDDFNKLIIFLLEYNYVNDISYGDIMQYLKDEGTDYWENGNDGNNYSGFTALPGGHRDIYGNYDFLGTKAFFWQSDNSSNLNYGSGIYMLLNDQSDEYGDHWRKNEGKSLRCVKD